MTLAIAIAACLLAAAACSILSMSATSRGRQVLTLVAIVTPLAMLGAILRPHRDAAPADTFQVVGQFAPAGDTLLIGSGHQSDVRIATIDADSESVVRLIPDRAPDRLRVETTPGMSVPGQMSTAPDGHVIVGCGPTAVGEGGGGGAE